jgi:hypothetical protein
MEKDLNEKKILIQKLEILNKDLKKIRLEILEIESKLSQKKESYNMLLSSINLK